jgi:hypothetical protein
MTDLPVGLISMAVTCSDVPFRQNADITRLAGIQLQRSSMIARTAVCQFRENIAPAACTKS